jgi:hypothetical protein
MKLVKSGDNIQSSVLEAMNAKVDAIGKASEEESLITDMVKMTASFLRNLETEIESGSNVTTTNIDNVWKLIIGAGWEAERELVTQAISHESLCTTCIIWMDETKNRSIKFKHDFKLIPNGIECVLSFCIVHEDPTKFIELDSAVFYPPASDKPTEGGNG